MRGHWLPAWHRPIVVLLLIMAVVLPTREIRAQGTAGPGAFGEAIARQYPGAAAENQRQNLVQFIDMVLTHVATYWDRELGGVRVPQAYAPAAGRAVQTACGVSSDSPFYCPRDERIVLPQVFFTEKVGWPANDAAVAIVIAHEWGHHVQKLIGQPALLTIVLELQADCFSGAFLKYAQDQGYLDPGDLDEVARQTFGAGDPFGTPWFDPQAHGTPRQRLQAVNDGFRSAGARCYG
jgi:predicted metalloprotease